MTRFGGYFKDIDYGDSLKHMAMLGKLAALDREQKVLDIVRGEPDAHKPGLHTRIFPVFKLSIRGIERVGWQSFGVYDADGPADLSMPAHLVASRPQFNYQFAKLAEEKT